MTAMAEQSAPWLETFTRQPKPQPWTQPLREAAFSRFVQTGFPTTHDEEWRFTNVAPIARATFDAAVPAPEGANAAPAFTEGARLVFVNGFEAGMCELPAGVSAGPLTEEAKQYMGQLCPTAPRNAFVDLNTAFFGGGLQIRVARGTVVEQPIHIVYITVDGSGANSAATHPRTLVVAGADAQCSIVETHIHAGGGAAAYFTNAMTEIAAASGAVVDYCKVQLEGSGAFHIGSVFAGVGRSASFRATAIDLGGKLVRNDVNVKLSEGAEAVLNGLYIVSGSQHVDNHTSLDHAEPHGTSRELYKGILDGQAKAVFNGRVLVRKDAQKTDSKQTNKNLVLSDNAVIDSKPELQIFADDVRCTHGATIGQLDAESIFYLKSRGIGAGEARKLLTYAFAQDVVNLIKAEPVRAALELVLLGKFNDGDK
jgi:Fe-S cluster assembly protein SufD